MIKIVPSTCVGTLFTTCFYTLFPNHIAPKMFQSSEVKSSKSWQYVLHSTSQMSSIVALQEEKTGELLGRTAWCHEATDPLTLTGPKWPCWSTEYSTFKIKPKKKHQQLGLPFQVSNRFRCLSCVILATRRPCWTAAAPMQSMATLPCSPSLAQAAATLVITGPLPLPLPIGMHNKYWYHKHVHRVPWRLDFQ